MNYRKTVENSENSENRIHFGGGKSEQKVILQPKSSNFKELRIIILKLPNYLPKEGKSNFIDIY